MTSQALNRPVDVQSFFADLLCYLSSRDDLAGYEIEQTEKVRDAVLELAEATGELVEVSKFAAMMDFLPTPANANGPLPRTIAALAAIGSQP